MKEFIEKIMKQAESDCSTQFNEVVFNPRWEILNEANGLSRTCRMMANMVSVNGKKIWIEAMIEILENLKKEPIKWKCGKIVTEEDRDYDGSIICHCDNDDCCGDVESNLSGWDILGANTMIAETNKQIDQAIQSLKSYII